MSKSHFIQTGAISADNCPTQGTYRLPLWAQAALPTLLMWHFPAQAVSAATLAQLSAYYMPYNFNDSRREDIAIAGLFGYFGSGQHSMALEASETRDNLGEAFGRDYTGVYTYWSNNTLRYRVGGIHSTAERGFSGQLADLTDVQVDYTGTFSSRSLGIILGVFKDSYSELGLKRYSRGLDLYFCRHTTDQNTHWRVIGAAEYDEASWLERDIRERWTLQLSQHFSVYRKGLADGFIQSTLHFHFITLNETLSRSYEHYHQLEFHAGHFWPRWHLQAMAAHGGAAYVYQAGGFVGYNTTDILKNGLGLEMGWALSKNVSAIIKMQAYRYQDPQRQMADERQERTDFRKTLAMLTYQF